MKSRKCTEEEHIAFDATTTTRMNEMHQGSEQTGQMPELLGYSVRVSFDEDGTATLCLDLKLRPRVTPPPAGEAPCDMFRSPSRLRLEALAPELLFELLYPHTTAAV